MSRLIRVLSLGITLMLIAGSIAYVGCGGGESEPGKPGKETEAASGTPEVKSDGSSTVYPVAEAVAEEFQIETKGEIHVTVGISGTGGGFKKFIRGETDISNASRPILKEEMEGAKAAGIEYVELPICFDALTVAVSKENDWLESITVADLKKIWEPDAEKKVTRWNQVNPDWPDAEIVLFGAGTDSGTFDYFTEAIVGKSKSSRSDFTQSEDDNVLVQGIAGNKHALGYLPYSYYEANKDKLKALAIDWEKDEQGPVMPTLDNVLKGIYNPLSRPLFIYVNKKSVERPEVKQYVEFYLNNVAELAKEVNYLPLPAKAYEMTKERFQKRQTGSAFNGVPEVGVTVEELLERETKQ